jgi:hypothetical protein
MPIRSRTLYNVQGLFVVPFSGNSKKPYLDNYKILRPIINLQNIDYSIRQPSINLISFGNKKSVFRGSSAPPEVTFQFTYLSDGVTNERRLDFNAYTFSDSPNVSMQNNAFTDLDASSFKDKKDFYLIVNKSEEDIYKKNSILNDEFYYPSGINNIIDEKSINYGLLHFQNAYLSRYNFSLSPTSIGVVSQEYSAENITFYSSGSGINYTNLNLKSGTTEIQPDKIIVPRSVSGLSGKSFLFSKDAAVSFSKNINSGILFETDMITSLNFGLEFEREQTSSINYRLPISRNLKYPIKGNFNVSFNVTGEFTGSFFDTLSQNIDYTILVNFNSDLGNNYKTQFLFSGCRFNNINYNNNIKDNFKNATLNFDFEQDFGNNFRGLFWSGNSEWGTDQGNVQGSEQELTFELLGTESGIDHDLYWVNTYILD